MHKAKQISKRAKNSRYNVNIQKEDLLDKTNHRPISILPIVSKFSKEYYLNNYSVFQINLFRLCSVDSGKGKVLSMPL